MYLIWVVLIGILAGWIAGQITKGRGFGPVGDLIVGILGVIWATFCLECLGLSPTVSSAVW